MPRFVRAKTWFLGIILCMFWIYVNILIYKMCYGKKGQNKFKTYQKLWKVGLSPPPFGFRKLRNNFNLRPSWFTVRASKRVHISEISWRYTLSIYPSVQEQLFRSFRTLFEAHIVFREANYFDFFLLEIVLHYQ